MMLMRPIAALCFVIVLLSAAPRSQARDAAAVLAEMRQALGGDAALDAITAFSLRGTIAESMRGRSRSMSKEVWAALPDRFLDIRRDFQGGGPMPVDITYYFGFHGDTLLRRTDSNIPFPPDPGSNTPAATAERERNMTRSAKQQFARLAFVLFGRSFTSYPLQFDWISTGQFEGRAVDVLDATAPDGYKMRVSIDALTHLPAVISYLAEQPVVVTTSSTLVTRGDTVVSRSPQDPLPTVPSTANLPRVEARLEPSGFKAVDGVNWPRKLRERVGAEIVRDINLNKLVLNPKIDARRFDIPR
jgi:hypothetical protein